MGFGLILLALSAFTLEGSHLLSAAHAASDEAAYLQYARNILHGTYAARGQQREGLYLWHSPALPLLLAPLVWLRVPLQIIRLTGPIFIVASGMTLTAVLRRFVRPTTALAAGLLLCLYPPFWRLLPQLFVEPLALLMSLLGFLGLVRASETRRLRWAAAAGLPFGYMVLGRDEYGYMLLACLALSALGLLVRSARAACRPIVVSCLVALVVCAPWLAYTYSKTHAPFYWSAASGESIYWMSSAGPGETGSWLSVRQVLADPRLASHRPLFDRVVRMSQLRGNRTLVRVAIHNIERDPGNYLHHVVQNGERMFVGVPFSFQPGEAENLAFYGVPDVLLLVAASAGSLMLWRRRVRIPGRLVGLVAFGLGGLAYHLPVAAYPRMATLSIPAFLVLAALGVDARTGDRVGRATPAAVESRATGGPSVVPDDSDPAAVGAAAGDGPGRAGPPPPLAVPELRDGGEADLLDRPGASRSLVRGSAGRTAAYVLASIANAAVLPFLFRYLGVDRSGQYVTVVSLATILAGIVETGLTGVSLRVYSLETGPRRAQLMRDLLAMRLGFLTLATALLLAFVLVSGYPSVVVVGFLLCAAGAFAENTGSTYNTWLSAHLRLGWIAISNVIRQFLVAALMIGLIVVHAPLVWFFVVVIPASIAQMLVSVIVTWGKSPLLPSLRVRSWLPLAIRSTPYVVAMALGFVYFRIPLIVVSLMRPGRPTGLFGAAFRLIDTLTLMTGFVLTATVPLLTRAAGTDPYRHRHGVKRVVEASLIIGAAISVVAVTGSQVAIAVLAGPEFGASVGLLELLSVVLVVKFVTTAWGFALLSVGDYRSVLVSSALATGASLVASVVGVTLIGVYGAAIGTLIAELTLAAAYAVRVQRRLGTHAFPLRTAAAVLVSGLIACTAVLAPGPDLARPFVAGAVYALLLLAMGAYPPEALDLLPWRRFSRAS